MHFVWNDVELARGQEARHYLLSAMVLARGEVLARHKAEGARSCSRGPIYSIRFDLSPARHTACSGDITRVLDTQSARNSPSRDDLYAGETLLST